MAAAPMMMRSHDGNRCENHDRDFFRLRRGGLPGRSLNYRGSLWYRVGNGREEYRENDPVR